MSRKASLPLSRQAAAIITGAGSGIGRSFAYEVVRRGGQVICADIDEARAQQVASSLQALGGKAVAQQCDVGDAAQMALLSNQAERLLVSQQTGTLSLALRSMVPGVNDNDRTQSFTMDVRASRALSSLVALDLEEAEDTLPKTMEEAMVKARERASRRTEVKINRGRSIAVQKFGQ